MRLDIGCGIKPKGDVNVDLFRDETPYRRHEGISSVLNTHEIPNFVLADACHLPFRSSSFDDVLSISVLEHIEGYFEALREMWRVCKNDGKLYIETEHRLGGLFQIFRLRNKGAKTLHRFSRTFFLKVFGSSIIYIKVLYEMFGIPCGLEVVVQKGSRIRSLSD